MKKPAKRKPVTVARACEVFYAAHMKASGYPEKHPTLYSGGWMKYRQIALRQHPDAMAGLRAGIRAVLKLVQP